MSDSGPTPWAAAPSVFLRANLEPFAGRSRPSDPPPLSDTPSESARMASEETGEPVPMSEAPQPLSDRARLVQAWLKPPAEEHPPGLSARTSTPFTDLLTAERLLGIAGRCSPLSSDHLEALRLLQPLLSGSTTRTALAMHLKALASALALPNPEGSVAGVMEDVPGIVPLLYIRSFLLAKVAGRRTVMRSTRRWLLEWRPRSDEALDGVTRWYACFLHEAHLGGADLVGKMFETVETLLAGESVSGFSSYLLRDAWARSQLAALASKINAKADVSVLVQRLSHQDKAFPLSRWSPQSRFQLRSLLTMLPFLPSPGVRLDPYSLQRPLSESLAYDPLNVLAHQHLRALQSAAGELNKRLDQVPSYHPSREALTHQATTLRQWLRALSEFEREGAGVGITRRRTRMLELELSARLDLPVGDGGHPQLPALLLEAWAEALKSGALEPGRVKAVATAADPSTEQLPWDRIERALPGIPVPNLDLLVRALDPPYPALAAVLGSALPSPEPAARRFRGDRATLLTAWLKVPIDRGFKAAGVLGLAGLLLGAWTLGAQARQTRCYAEALGGGSDVEVMESAECYLRGLDPKSRRDASEVRDAYDGAVLRHMLALGAEGKDQEVIRLAERYRALGEGGAGASDPLAPEEVLIQSALVAED